MHREPVVGRARALALAAAIGALLLARGCKEKPDHAAPAPSAPAPRASTSATAPESLGLELAPRPSSSAGALVLRSVQASKLDVPPQVDQLPRLALSRSLLGRLTSTGWEVRSLGDFHELASRPLSHPLAVLALADGSLVALDTDRSERFDVATQKVQTLPALPLLPGVRLFADAQQLDRIWALEGRSGRPASLSGYRLSKSDDKLVLPETTTELGEGASHGFGLTRDGIFLHLLRGRVERWGPSGARLAALTMPEAELPTWALPAKRLDQSLWLRDSGALERVWLSTPFKVLGRAQLAGRPVTAAVGNRGELLAAVIVTGPGPRFELELMDAELHELGRVVLPGDEPTGKGDWVRVVTANQHLAVSNDAPRVVVGGPDRLRIFDAGAHELFSIPSR